MSKTKFKPLDLVENIHTGELQLVIECTERGIAVVIYGFNLKKDNTIWFSTILAKDYEKISPKEIKFNLTNKPK